MSTHVTIAKSAILLPDEPSLAQHDLAEWHIYRDSLDTENDTIHVEVHRLRAVETHAAAGRAPAATLSLAAHVWWDVVAGSAAARARGHDTGGPVYAVHYDQARSSSDAKPGVEVLDEASPAAREAARDRWVALSQAAGGGGAAAAYAIASRLGDQAALLARAGERALGGDVDVLEAALLVAGVLADTAHTVAARVRQVWQGQGADVANALEYLTVDRPWILRGRTPLEAVVAGDAETVLRSLASIEHGLPA